MHVMLNMHLLPQKKWINFQKNTIETCFPWSHATCEAQWIRLRRFTTISVILRWPLHQNDRRQAIRWSKRCRIESAYVFGEAIFFSLQNTTCMSSSTTYQYRHPETSWRVIRVIWIPTTYRSNSVPDKATTWWLGWRKNNPKEHWSNLYGCLVLEQK